jgi:hypothetical protein
MKITKSTLNSLKTVTPLLQNLLTELQKQINHKDNQSIDYSESHKEEIFNFFRNNKELVDTVFFKEKYGKVRTCYIALKKDTTKNRDIVFDFLDKYEQETKQSFFIQFIPLSFVEKFNHFPKVNLDAKPFKTS